MNLKNISGCIVLSGQGPVMLAHSTVSYSWLITSFLRESIPKFPYGNHVPVPALAWGFSLRQSPLNVIVQILIILQWRFRMTSFNWKPYGNPDHDTSDYSYIYPVPSSDWGWVAANFAEYLQGWRSLARWTAACKLSYVQSLTLSSQVALGRPLDLFLSTLPSRIVVPNSTVLLLATCPK